LLPLAPGVIEKLSLAAGVPLIVTLQPLKLIGEPGVYVPPPTLVLVAGLTMLYAVGLVNTMLYGVSTLAAGG
jgi:hypothetical protein